MIIYHQNITLKEVKLWAN